MTTTANTESDADEGTENSQRITFFDRADNPGVVFGEHMVTASVSVPEELGTLYNSALANRLTTRVLLNQGPGGFSLVESEVAPGTRVPRHNHNLPQVALIIAGEMRQGRRVLGPGAGYFTPANQSYTFVAGPEGCRYVEFRLGAVEEITTDVVETNPARLVHEY